eukprot:CAMPEP_0175891622 /NCGR_PEP_ID=MMETSP0107_2-20121207/48481_1 /TAXON_ID=195067 ORGANISM="Goniomonas pacifica, Strain CCMP1869" /NCGR_SAMPLE_ID=MMETSP0107_2 /ASSEMBLY_ACC=CAM_ASM_000203 /LENGTH=86 /DNA_ID=CAMNT_0017212509 /DNA_START=332 /DNA_END=593 /DNA_ORIENTATION=+
MTVAAAWSQPIDLQLCQCRSIFGLLKEGVAVGLGWVSSIASKSWSTRRCASAASSGSTGLTIAPTFPLLKASIRSTSSALRSIRAF